MGSKHRDMNDREVKIGMTVRCHGGAEGQEGKVVALTPTPTPHGVWTALVVNPAFEGIVGLHEVEIIGDVEPADEKPPKEEADSWEDEVEAKKPKVRRLKKTARQ